MQQLQSTTAEQSEQTAQTFSVVPLETVTPSEVTETNAVQQEQADAVAKLLAALERDTKKRRKWNERLGIAMIFFMASMLVFILIAWRMTGQFAENFRYFQVINIVNFAGFALGKFFLDKNAAIALTTVEDVRCVGALMDVWGAQGNINYTQQVREQARAALTRLLPCLQAGDAPLLKETHRAVLRNILTSSTSILTAPINARSKKAADVEFTLAILKAFENVGDWKSAPYVKRLTGPATAKRIRDAASECLPYLQALAEKHKPGETLLRASSATDAANVSPETLLRPAAPQPETDPDTLLRPSEENS